MKKCLLLLLVIGLQAGLLHAQSNNGDYRSNGIGSWDNPGSWQRYNNGWVAATDYPGQNPGTGLVTILDAHIISMTATPANSIGALTIATGNTTSALALGTSVTLNVSGVVTIQNSATNGETKFISLLTSSSHLICASLAINGGNNPNRKSYLDMNGGSVTVTGNITMDANAASSYIQFSTGTLNIAGSISGGAIIPGTGTVNFNNNGSPATQTIPVYNYHNITVSNAVFAANEKVPAGNLNITGDITCNGGSLNLKNSSITLAAGKKCTINNDSKLILDGTGTIITTNGGNTLDMKQGSYLDLKSATAQIPDFASYTIDNASRLNINFNGNQPNLNFRGQSWGFTFFEGSGTKTLATNLTCTSFDILDNITLNTGTFTIACKPTGFTSQVFLDGTLTGTGKVIFNNDNLVNFQSSGAPFTFYDLEINMAAANLVLRMLKNITVSHTLTLTQGKIFTEGNTLTLSNADPDIQLVGGSANSYVYSTGAGRFRRNNIASSPVIFPVGSKSTIGTNPQYYLPVFLVHGVGSGDYAVNVFEGLTTNGAEGGPALTDNNGVNAIWNIDQVGGSPTTGTDVEIQWDGALEGSAFSSLGNTEIGITRYAGGWQSATASGANQATNTVFGTFTSFSPFAVSKKNYVLPVKFGPITAFEKNNGVQLDWTVYTETNMDKYVVERSANGSQFTPLGEVASRNATGEYKYGYFDANPLPGTSFYRLRSVDIDSKAGFSNIVRVNLDKNDAALRLYPNPANGGAISYQAANLPKGNYALRIFNAAGQQVYNQRMAHQGGAITQTIQLPAGLAAGQYNLRMESETTIVGTKTFMVQ